MSEEQGEPDSRNKMGTGIAVGAGLGAGLGVVMDDFTQWLAIGMGIGIALGAAWSQTGNNS
ncbi:hypothetical protein [Halalkalicoccus subterraneus]|uniref:hypothetical protein n=1 Tax=Halalkalicoccus subterraneus TaxID=2675002 RepID=UPI000EFC9AC7|nr:hypothetical protein [Halalkalicoccus subterraneus]